MHPLEESPHDAPLEESVRGGRRDLALRRTSGGCGRRSRTGRRHRAGRRNRGRSRRGRREPGQSVADAARQPSARGSSARSSQRSQHGIGKGRRPARESSDQPSRSGVTPPGCAVFACPLQERAEAHSGRAGGLARPAAQASVDVMGEGPVGRHATFDGEPHEMESSPGRVVLVAGRLVGRASREAEAAVHARGEIGSAIQ